MAWEGSDRRQRLPPDWNPRRAHVLDRDGHRCCVVEHDTRCPQRATDVDHIVNNDDHSYGNLASICTYHHKQKTAAEAAAGRNTPQARARRAHNSMRRPSEPHPGVIG